MDRIKNLEREVRILTEQVEIAKKALAQINDQALKALSEMERKNEST
jgi:hypothetical protein